ncbi:MAG: hypothetical protein P8J51_05920 [Dehalococcoidia bacterium]|nr:hypothetical protein [Dehalococcoidia bacterium]
MGEKELQALRDILEDVNNKKYMIGAWSINFNKEQNTFQFDKCEFGGYCEEKPVIINLEGTVLDKGGPII